MQNVVELLDNDIIYVRKIGPQTKWSMLKLFSQVNDFAMALRQQNKPVLILSNTTKEGDMDHEAQEIANRIGKNLDYDKSATYGSSPYLFEMRQHLIAEAGLGDKIADFRTRKQAVDWLLRN